MTNSERPQNKNLRPPRQKGDPPLGDGGGRKPLSEIEREARKASRQEIAETFQALKGMTIEEIRKLDIKSLPAVQAWFISAIQKGIQKGDTSELHRMYDRLLGKPRATVDLTTKEVDMSRLTDSQLERLIAGEDIESVLLNGGGESTTES